MAIPKSAKIGATYRGKAANQKKKEGPNCESLHWERKGYSLYTN